MPLQLRGLASGVLHRLAVFVLSLGLASVLIFLACAALPGSAFALALMPA